MSQTSSANVPITQQDLPLSETGSAHAPFVYFEHVPAYGIHDGVIRVTLEAVRIFSNTLGEVRTDRVVVAHLRMNLRAAKTLRDALDGALLLANRPPSEMKN